MALTIWKLEDQEFELKLTYGKSLRELPKLGINLNDIFTDEEVAADTMRTLLIDDEKCLGLAWFFIKDEALYDYDGFVDKMTPALLDDFREKFWAEVVNFSGPLKKDLLQEIWTTFKRELKKEAKKALKEAISTE